MNEFVEKLDMKVLGERLQKVRQHLKLKQSDVAEEVGCATLTISRMERGEITTSVVPVLVFYSQSISMDLLFGKTFDPEDEAVYCKNPAMESHVKARLKLLQGDVRKHIDGKQRKFGENVQRLADKLVQDLNKQMMSYTLEEQEQLMQRLDDTIELL